MPSEKRNATVVIALILSMTVGAQVLLCAESWIGAAHTHWQGEALLSAERGGTAREVVVSLKPLAALSSIELGADDSVCLIDPAGEPEWHPAGPRVQVILLGLPDTPELSDQQQRTLLATIATLSQLSGTHLLPVRLADGNDPRVNSALPAQYHDLLALLVRKDIID